jgi:hydroxypyruvate reductase
VNAGGLVRRALHGDVSETLRGARALDVIAAGKAASAMLNAFASSVEVPIRTMLGVGPSGSDPLSPNSSRGLTPMVEWQDAGHPLPNEGSMKGARRALEIARSSGPGDVLMVLISGGGSALMALPAPGISLEDKQQTARTLMARSADIYELNTVRKHLSAIKGGRLAAASSGRVLTFAVSDVVGDDLSVIASGPTVADESTFADALDVLSRRDIDSYPASVVRHLQRGLAGEIEESPKSGDPRLARAVAHVIGPQRGAIDGAKRAAEQLGYRVHIVPEPITGEARLAARAHLANVSQSLNSLPRPLCVISSGETTVTVVGRGKGGRNQEFALAMAPSLETLGSDVVAASIGTDGIDGPTDAAGALVDPKTLARAAALGLPAAQRYLDDNNAYEFFDRLGDLIRTGPTNTNVGDLQVILVRQ